MALVGILIQTHEGICIKLIQVKQRLLTTKQYYTFHPPTFRKTVLL